MRIISKFHDYYDSVQGMGQDRSLIYQRTPRRVVYTRDTFPLPLCNKGSNYAGRLWIWQRIIGFCGRIYPGIIVTYRGEDRRTTCSSAEEFDACIANELDKKELERFRPRKRPNAKYDTHRGYWGVIEYFEACRAAQASVDRLFADAKSPIFATRPKREPGSDVWTPEPRDNVCTIEWNPILKEYDFQTIVDPYTAFQEISMYIGGVLGVNSRPIPEMTDEVKIDAHGLDKYSFRSQRRP